jgi:hypothetical protein
VIGWGAVSLKNDIENDIIKLNEFADLLNTSDSENIKDFVVKEKTDKRLDYTLDFMVYPFIGALVAIFLAFVWKF